MNYAAQLSRWINGLKKHLGVSQEKFAERLGVSQPTVHRWLSGEDKPTDENLDALAAVAVEERYPLPPAPRRQDAPLAHVAFKVGAGAEVFPIHEDVEFEGIEDAVPPPPGFLPEEVRAARVEGDSMRPIQDGWLVFFTMPEPGLPDRHIGKLCVIELPDGAMLLKTPVRAGAGYTLESWNAPTRYVESINRSSRVVDIRPR